MVDTTVNESLTDFCSRFLISLKASGLPVVHIFFTLSHKQTQTGSQSCSFPCSPDQPQCIASLVKLSAKLWHAHTYRESKYFISLIKQTLLCETSTAAVSLLVTLCKNSDSSEAVWDTVNSYAQIIFKNVVERVLCECGCMIEQTFWAYTSLFYDFIYFTLVLHLGVKSIWR